MAKIAILTIYCDRCTKEIGRAAESDKDAKDIPDYYRQVKVAEAGAVAVDEKKLDHLCGRCKKEVEELDKRIFSDSRVRKTDAETTNQETADA